MISVTRKLGYAGAAAAVILLGACSNTPRSAAGPQGQSYKVGRASAELSRAAAATPTQAQPRAQAAGAARGGARAKPAVNGQAAATRPSAPAAGVSPATVQAQSAGAQTFAGPASTPLAVDRSAAPEAVTPTPAAFSPLRLDRVTAGAARAMQPVTQAVESAAPWSWLAAIGAGFLAALALAWVLRPRRSEPPRDELYVAPTPANDPEEPRRAPVRRSQPPPPKVTILAGAGGR